MTDTYGDGWNGNVFSIYQQGNSPHLLGVQFTSGRKSEASVELLKGDPAEIIVAQTGKYSYECGFEVISSEN